ncbi:MAG: hypothetical protein ABEJ42_00780 [Halobacteriaceae archaeon]
MTELKLHPGCFETCPYLETVEGSCGHELQSLITIYLYDNPDAPCPIYEEARADEMQDLAERLDHLETDSE